MNSARVRQSNEKNRGSFHALLENSIINENRKQTESARSSPVCLQTPDIGAKIERPETNKLN